MLSGIAIIKHWIYQDNSAGQGLIFEVLGMTIAGQGLKPKLTPKSSWPVHAHSHLTTQ